jgi:hypothetical protein
MDKPSPFSPESEGTSEDPETQHHADLSAGRLAQEAAGEFAGLERRLPRTLILLLTRPGFLTLEHREGRGREYVSPVRLYILASTIYFATSIAAAPRGLNLGLLTVISVGELPSVAPAIILIVAVPIFAPLLSGPFHREGSPFGEYLIFALYFQSILLLVLIAVELLPIGDPLNDYLKLAYFVGYVGLAGKRLWEPNILWAFGKALASFIAYALAILLVYGAAVLIQNLLF